jgi:hypothetical protein
MAELIDITYDNLLKKKIAAKEVRYMELHDKVELKRYELLYKKGDLTSIVKFLPFPHIEKVPREESYFRYPDFTGYSRIDTESELLAKDDTIMVEDNKVYYKPCIILHYADDRKLRIFFDTYASALKAWDSFMYRFGEGLKRIV